MKKDGFLPFDSAGIKSVLHPETGEHVIELSVTTPIDPPNPPWFTETVLGYMPLELDSYLRLSMKGQIKFRIELDDDGKPVGATMGGSTSHRYE
jgi:hypothetical protein